MKVIYLKQRLDFQNVFFQALQDTGQIHIN